MATKKKPKRKKKIIRTPKREPLETEVEFLERCVEAAHNQVEDQQEKVLELVDKLARANKVLKDKEAARYRYAGRLNKAQEDARKEPVKLVDGVKGAGELLIDENGRADPGAYIPA